MKNAIRWLFLKRIHQQIPVMTKVTEGLPTSRKQKCHRNKLEMSIETKPATKLKDPLFSISSPIHLSMKHFRHIYCCSSTHQK